MGVPQKSLSTTPTGSSNNNSNSKASGLLILLGVCMVLLFIHHAIIVMWFQEQLNHQQKQIDVQKVELQTLKGTVEDIDVGIAKQKQAAEEENQYKEQLNQKLQKMQKEYENIKNSRTNVNNNPNNNNDNDGQPATSAKEEETADQKIQFKFPSVKERVKYYMGDWYYDIQNNNNNNNNRTLTASSSSSAAQAETPPPKLPKDLCNRHPYWQKDVHNPACCKNYLMDETNLKQHPLTMYAEDVLNYVVPVIPPSWSTPTTTTTSTTTSTGTRTNDNKANNGANGKGTANSEQKDDDDLSRSKFKAFFHFGDTRSNNSKDLPVIFKSRSVDETKSILFPLNTVRHFDIMKRIPGMDTTPWEEKLHEIVWRGGNVGKRYGLRQLAVEKYIHYDPNTTKIDIAFSDIFGQNPKDTNPSYLRPSVTRWAMLKNKYLLSIEGNDVASDLKWMLYSNSVVFMVPPTVSSWAMEDQLVPYYHYIPLSQDLSDIPQKMEWAKQNDEKCKQIAQQATQFMKDVWASDEAQLNNAKILSEMTYIYNEVYGKAIGKCKKK